GRAAQGPRARRARPAAWRVTVARWGGKAADTAGVVRVRGAMAAATIGEGNRGRGWGSGEDCRTLPHGIRTRPVPNAGAAGLPGPHGPQRARSTNAQTVSHAPLSLGRIRDTWPQVLPGGRRRSRVNNFPGTARPPGSRGGGGRG